MNIESIKQVVTCRRCQRIYRTLKTITKNYEYICHRDDCYEVSRKRRTQLIQELKNKK